MSQQEIFKFKLYIASNSPNSPLAVANLTAFCQTYLPDRHEIEIVDVYQEPKGALENEIYMTPTLVKLVPVPTRRIVGTLSQTKPLLQALGLHQLPNEPGNTGMPDAE